MDLVLVPAIVLVMYATLRSPTAGLVVGVGIAALAIPTGERSLLLFATAVGGAGLLVGLATRARMLASRAILLGAVPTALAVAAQFPGREALRERLDEAMRLQSGDALTSAARDQLVNLVADLMPAFAALFGFTIVFVSYAVAARLLPRFGVSVRRMGRLDRLRLPFAVIWSFAFSLLACVAGRGLGQRWLLTIGANLMVVHGAAFFVEGLAIGRFALRSRGLPDLVQWILALSAFLMPMPLIVIGLGLLDLWFDFRRLLTPPAEGS